MLAGELVPVDTTGREPSAQLLCQRQRGQQARRRRNVPDWIDLATETTLAGLDTAAASLLESQTHTTEMTFDALGRPVTQTTPDTSVTRYGYNDGGLLESVEADVRGASPPTVFVENIDYDVWGRRALIEHGNGTTTTYDYDQRSFRLRRLHTTRESTSDPLQDLRYFYDPVGNIVEVHDFAQQTVYFDNAEVEPHQLFEYDSLYRLVLARGREHSSLSQPTHADFSPEPLPHPNDPAPLRNYEQTYAYDEVGNITRMAHQAGNGSFSEIWTRGYDYAADGNRLLATSLPGDDVEDPQTYSATYTYDAHGNMTSMPHLAAIDWDHADRMQHADLGGGGDVYFQYDAQGNRVRKVRVNQSGSAANERIYLGAVELYRERAVDSPAVLGDIDLERETLHISDDTGRIVMVETLTIDEGDPVVSPANIARYQYGNHLGSAAVEADDGANIISYEEFHPYGTTSYAASNSNIEVSAKRYRYIGKERDEETGLYHLGARYYASWLARWTAADPIGLGDGVNRYAYARGNPIVLTDASGMAAKPFKPGAVLNQEQVETYRQDASTVAGNALPVMLPGGEDYLVVPKSAIRVHPGESSGQGDHLALSWRGTRGALWSARYAATADALREKRATEAAARQILQAGEAIEQLVIAELALLGGGVATGLLAGVGVGTLLAEMAGGGLGGIIHGGGTAAHEGEGAAGIVERALTEGGGGALTAGALGLLSRGAFSVLGRSGGGARGGIPSRFPSPMGRSMISPSAGGGVPSSFVGAARTEVAVLQRQGLSRSEAFAQIRRFNAGHSDGYAFHFTNLKGGQGIAQSGIIRGGFGLRGPGVYAGTTPTPSVLLKYGPTPGWALTPIKNVRIPIKLDFAPTPFSYSIPLKTLRFPVPQLHL